MERPGLLKETYLEWRFCAKEAFTSKCGIGFAFAILCVLVVIVGNVVLLIAVNFWLSIFPKHKNSSNSGQIAAQVIVSVFLIMLFSFVGLSYVACCGFRPLWHVLSGTDRMRRPLFRLLLLFLSGATNALTGVLSVYAMSHTPEFIQAILLTFIPFCAQMWTYIFVSEERNRRYRSLTLLASVIFFVSGVLLSSISSFYQQSKNAKVVPWNWTLVYLSSTVVFGLWCVVQRLYLDAVMFCDKQMASAGVVVTERETNFEGQPPLHCVIEEELSESYPLVAKRQWGKQNKDDLAAKTVLLLVGVLFQAIVSFLCIPTDAIPWFGTTSSIADSWTVFCDSCVFIFASWHNVRLGVLYAFGLFMSFVGCAYLNERSPTLASVVLQLSAPVTGLVLIIVPQWDVYGEHGVLGHKVGGVILLTIAGMLYYVWDQASLHELVEKCNQDHLRQEEEDETEQRQESSHATVTNIK